LKPKLNGSRIEHRNDFSLSSDDFGHKHDAAAAFNARGTLSRTHPGRHDDGSVERAAELRFVHTGCRAATQRNATQLTAFRVNTLS